MLSAVLVNTNNMLVSEIIKSLFKMYLVIIDKNKAAVQANRISYILPMELLNMGSISLISPTRIYHYQFAFITNTKYYYDALS